MNIHEFQAKALLKAYGVPVPGGTLAATSEAAQQAARALGGDSWAVKAQIHAGGRGKAGGIKLAHSADEVAEAARGMLGRHLVTYQTGAEGKAIRQIYVERACQVVRELYLAVLVDRSVGRVAVLASAVGGEDIEQTATSQPDKILKLVVDPGGGLDPAAARKLAGDLGLAGAQAAAAADLVAALYQAFLDKDASLIEINPLGVTDAGDLIALDIKMSVDDNALFRHPDIEALRDQDEVDPTELEAARYELNYVRLDGSIGCMVNGAGLALATLDMIKQAGGEPADFMDVRPVVKREQIAYGCGMILANPRVKAILVNIYGGGILRCDTVAEGIAMAVKQRGLTVPLIVRVAGTNDEIARKVLTSQAIPVIFASDMADAAERAVKAVGREAA